MKMPFCPVENRFVAELNARALSENYDSILSRTPDQFLLPMVKAAAYGHGAEWVGCELVTKKGLYGFGVATLTEGKRLRAALKERGRKTRILVFSGCAPWSDEVGQFCEREGLTPALCTESDWAAFFKGGWCDRIAYELKFNTGMNRLGLPPALAPSIARRLRSKTSTAHPSGIFSHLAIAEDPDCRLSRTQISRFKALRAEFAGVLPSTSFHLGNSAAIWLQNKWHLKDLTDVVRPGIALYGIPPWDGAPRYGIEPVMRLKARVIAIQNLREGDRVGYGGRFVVSAAKSQSGGQTQKSCVIGILSAGYADGIHRLLGGRGHPSSGEGGFVSLNSKESRILGTVSMDLTAIRCHSDTRVGDWAILWGPEIDPWMQAKKAETIPYELLTSVSTRVQREYV